jgi:hypothetical protein
MATQPLPPNDDQRPTAALSHVSADAGAPVESLVAATVGDRCVNCGSPLTSDQRYCVVCGERRGAARFSLPATAPAAAMTETTSTISTITRDSRRARRGFGNSGTSLIAGVATLLLAILVGVLIGHNTANSQKTIAAGPTKIIRVGGGAAAPASSGSTGAAGSAASGSSASSSAGAASKGSGKAGGAKAGGAKKGASQAAKPAVSKKTQEAQQQAASKVTGGSGGAPPTVTVGQKLSKGTPGVNKKTGKFDGSFFH